MYIGKCVKSIAPYSVMYIFILRLKLIIKVTVVTFWSRETVVMYMHRSTHKNFHIQIQNTYKIHNLDLTEVCWSFLAINCAYRANMAY
jgi:hypothetical protein